MVIVYMMMLRRRQKRRSEQRESEMTQGVEKRRGDSELRATMERLVIELEELSREVSAKIDTKMKTLEVLIRQADERIDALKNLVPTSDEKSRELAARYSEVYELADSGTSLGDIAKQMGMHAGEVELILSLRRFQ
jgi:DNA-binding NarL/FixJ family response regulator